jgi:uncharacterized protein YukE
MSWEALGGNPVPGDPGVALRLATGYGEICEQAEQITSRLRALDGGSGPEVWRGQAADAFRDKLAKVGPDLITMATHYRQASEALREFARSLDEAQATARRAEADAGSALLERDAAASRRDTANRDARSADGTALLADGKIVAARAQAAIAAPLDPTYQAAMQDWERRVATQRDAARSQAADARRRAGAAASEAASAQARVEAAKRLAGQAEAVRNDAARTAAARIKAADAPGYDDRSLWDKLWDGASSTVKRIDRALDDLTSRPEFQSAMNILSSIGDVMSGIGTVLSFLSFIPGVGAVAAGFLIAAAVFKGLSLAGTMLAARYGNASWKQVGGRAIDFGLSVFPAGSATKSVYKAASKIAGKGAPVSAVLRATTKARTGPVTKLGGEIKRSIWYDDARRATGELRKIPVASKLGAETTERLASYGIKPADAFLVKTTITAADTGIKAGDMVDKVWNSPQDLSRDISAFHDPEDQHMLNDELSRLVKKGAEYGTGRIVGDEVLGKGAEIIVGEGSKAVTEAIVK